MWILEGEMPTEIRARTLSTLQAESSPDTVPGEIQVELAFGSGVSGSFYNSFLTEHQQWVHVSGDKGYLRVDDFVLPYHGSSLHAYVGQDRFEVDNCEFHMESHLKRHSVREYDSNLPGAQEVKLFERFASIVLSGELESEWLEWTLKTQKVLDACFESARQDGAPVKLA